MAFYAHGKEAQRLGEDETLLFIYRNLARWIVLVLYVVQLLVADVVPLLWKVEERTFHIHYCGCL